MIKYFLRFVEIKTKIVSVGSFFLGLAILLLLDMEINLVNLVLFFISMLAFDMFTTGLNSVHALTKEHDMTVEDHKMAKKMRKLGITLTTNITILIVLFLIGTLLGITLVLRTTLFIVLLGIICVAVGILYSYTPIAICKTPLGEVFSGFILGFFVVFTLVVSQGLEVIHFSFETVQIEFLIIPIFKIFLLSAPITICVANIMLGNNISDLEKDYSNARYTLPVYIGRKAAIKLLILLYMSIFAIVILNVALGFLPIFALVYIAMFFVFLKNLESIGIEKNVMMSYVIKNYVTLAGSYIILVFVCSFL